MTIRYAWYGRVSTEDEQDPTLSFPRQLGNAKRRIGDDGVIVAHFYDIESGKRRYEDRGTGNLTGFDIDIPRDGGLQELLTSAAGKKPPFDRIIVESINRLSRNSAVAFRIEEELQQAGIRLCCADEPIEESFGSIVLRHVNIGIARGYHHELMAKSRQGYEVAAQQGWHNGGIALYGYRFVTHPHPNPNKAKQGLFKRTLELDPVRAPVVRRIFDEYLGGGVGIRQIRDLLNADAERFPTRLAPDPTKSAGHWAASSIWEVLRNPKYTGYQVWNRKRSKTDNRPNPPDAWIWSAEQSHPAIVTIDEWRAVQQRAKANHRSRQGAASGRTEYLFKGLLRCGVCGLRMWGNRPRSRYYSCEPSHQRSTQIPLEHPKVVHVGENVLLDAVSGFLSDAVFGPDRLDYWRAALTDAQTDGPAADLDARVTEVNTDIASINERIDRQVLALEDADITPAIRRRISERINELEATLAERRVALEDLALQRASTPKSIDDIASALDLLPTLDNELRALPQRKVRDLLQALQMELMYHPDRRLNVRVALHGQSSDATRDAMWLPATVEVHAKRRLVA